MSFKLITLFFISSNLLLNSCGKKDCNDVINENDIKLNVKINRLDRALFACKSTSDVKQLLTTNPAWANGHWKIKQYPSDTILPNGMFQLIQSKGVDTLYKDCQRVFNDTSFVFKNFETAFKHIKHYYPKFKVPVVGTMISGLSSTEWSFSDSAIFIGIDYYLGNQSKYKPNYYDYVLKRYTPVYIVPTYLLFGSQQFNQTDFRDQSLLATMIWYGKSLYFAKKMMPCHHDTLFIGYTNEQLTDCKKHESIIWEHFISKKILYDNTPAVVNKYIGERPTTVEIGPKCPGRIGQWVGFQIINSYMEANPNVSLQDLMKNTDARKIFEASKYRPGK